MRSTFLSRPARLACHLVASWAAISCHSSEQSSAPSEVAKSPLVPTASQVPPISKPASGAGASSTLALKTDVAVANTPAKNPLSNSYRATRVLHLGDSMVPLVANYLRPAVHGTYEQMSVPSATALTWAEDTRLTEALHTVDPELVLISLGSNEIFVKEDMPLHLAAAKKIVKKLGGRTCLWIGPPAWAKGFGFVEALAEAVAPCAFFHSEKLKLARQADGRHPTFGASYTWANLVWKELGSSTPLP